MIERLNSPDLSAPPGYAHVVIASGSRLITPAGAVPLDAEGKLVGPGDYLAQTRQIMSNLEMALEAGGATARNVVKTTVYVVSERPSDLSAVWEVVQASAMSDAASTLVGVSVLGYEGQLVEIEAIAVLK
jgi:enamine deaminase RidA (YjgF/YER057c/UK114 family)